MDEMLVDVTAEAQRRIAQGSVPATWAAHVHSNKVGLIADNKHRPMDLRVLALRGVVTSVTAAGPDLPSDEWQPSGTAWEPLLMTGCVIAQEMRAVLKAETGFRCSAGISSNRMLAKLVSGLHKPDDQTVLLPPDTLDFVAPLPVRALPGVGYKMGNELDRMGVKTAADLRQVSQETLVQQFGERIATFLQLACRGQDPTPVQDKGPPKSITVEDSFKDCSSMQSAEHVIRVLAPDLLARMVEDSEETGRRASTLTLKWRHRGSGWARSSSSCPMPTPLMNPQPGDPSQISLLGSTLMALLKKHISEPFQLTLLNVGVTNFVGFKGAAAGRKAGWDPAFAKLMGASAKRQKLDSSQAASLPLHGASDSRSAALKSLNQRRDYGAQPSTACISKSIKRALREEGRVQQPSRAAPGNGLDALDWEEEEDWGREMMLEGGHAWKPKSLHGQQARLQTVTRPVQEPQQQQQQPPTAQLSGVQPQASRGLAPCCHQMSGHTGAAQPQDQASPSWMPQPNRQQGPTTNSTTQQAHRTPNALQQGQLVRQAVPAQTSDTAEGATLTADMDDFQMLGAAGCSPKASLPLKDSNSWSGDTAVAGGTADADHVPCQGTAQGDLDAVRLPGTCYVSCQVQAQPASLDTAAEAAQDVVTAAPNKAALVDGQAATCMPSSEQSDYQLALRLQAQEHAIHRSYSRPVVGGRVSVKQKQRQTSGTLHAFFKKF
ncbi:hypothetical protein ABBQ32_010474 [Trebouxia sp. C0010 RCD-2024]